MENISDVKIVNSVDAHIKVDDTTIVHTEIDQKTCAKAEVVSETKVKEDNVTIKKAKSVLTDDADEFINHENGTAETLSIGEKRKHEEYVQIIIPNTFKKLKTDQGCENGKTLKKFRKDISKYLNIPQLTSHYYLNMIISRYFYKMDGVTDYVDV